MSTASAGGRRAATRRGDPAQRPLGQHIGLGDAVGGQASRADVQVGQLGQQHYGTLSAVCST